jgi:hypothetical protein
VSNVSSQPNEFSIDKYKNQVKKIEPYFNTEITIKKGAPSLIRNSVISVISNNQRRTLISNIHPFSSGDTSFYANSSAGKEIT